MYQPLHFNTKEEEFDGAAERLSWCNRSDFPYDKVKRQAECALCQAYGGKNWIARWALSVLTKRGHFLLSLWTGEMT